MSCQAINERGELHSTPASLRGQEAGCLYCISRNSSEFKVGENALVLNGYQAGTVGRFGAFGPEKRPDTFILEDGIQYRIDREISLYYNGSIVPNPAVILPLNIRLGFIVDELACWFCNRAFRGTRFCWNQSDCLEVIRTCWEKRIPVSGEEVAAIFLAHGMHENYHAEFAEKFDFGISLLIATKGRPPIKKHRSEDRTLDVLTDFFRRT